MREDSEEIGSGDFVPWKMNSHESQIGGKKGWTAGKKQPPDDPVVFKFGSARVFLCYTKEEETRSIRSSERTNVGTKLLQSESTYIASSHTRRKCWHERVQ